MYFFNSVLKNESSQVNFNLNKRMLIQQPFLYWVYMRDDINVMMNFKYYFNTMEGVF